MRQMQSLIGTKSIPLISAVDLFCGAGGLTHGLLKSGINVCSGVDIDPKVKYAYEHNNTGAKFYCWDVGTTPTEDFKKLFVDSKYKLLAGCAPCQPFSKLTQLSGKHPSWNMLDHFGRLIEAIQPDLVTMENVPELGKKGADVFEKFKRVLLDNAYYVDWKIINCADYGVPQSRHRLVLLASKLGSISIPDGRYVGKWKTVRDAVGDLPLVMAGNVDQVDRLHRARKLSPLNLKRIQATPHNGGTRSAWPKELLPDCYKRKTGDSYKTIYGRMWWDKPAPTMTTLCTGLGNGRFGHPDQDRSITLREAALFQSFPKGYQFWNEEPFNHAAVSRMIGNAVPPQLSKIIGRTLVEHLSSLK